LGGCATVYPACEGIEGEAFDTCQEIETEYARVEYIETEFKPWLFSCYAQGGFAVYRGEMNRHLRKAFESNFTEYQRVRRIDLIGFECASSMRIY
jgi:hypothetical protein